VLFDMDEGSYFSLNEVEARIRKQHRTGKEARPLLDESGEGRSRAHDVTHVECALEGLSPV